MWLSELKTEAMFGEKHVNDVSVVMITRDLSRAFQENRLLREGVVSPAR